MAKLFIASDIHGSAHFAKIMLERFEEEKADQLILLGDVFYHGPRNPLPEDYAPMQVAEMLKPYADRLLVVKGNCDSDVDAMIAPFEFVNLAQLYVDGAKITLQHGDKYSKDNLPKNCGNALIYGHYHTSFVMKKDGITIANPGSVSLPKDNTKEGYIVVENGCIVLKSLSDGQLIAKEEII